MVLKVNIEILKSFLMTHESMERVKDGSNAQHEGHHNNLALSLIKFFLKRHELPYPDHNPVMKGFDFSLKTKLIKTCLYTALNLLIELKAAVKN